MRTDRSAGWNHNVAYHRLVLGAVPDGCRRALDVGCGEGLLARELRRLVPEVTAIDRDEGTIGRARDLDPDGQVDYVVADVLEADLEPGSFDLVCSIAALHHMDATAGLARMGELVRPGGTLVVVGLARSRHPIDFAYDVAGVVTNRLHGLTKPYQEITAPIVWAQPHTYSQVRRIARHTLPGARFRRLLLFRYWLSWTKPQT